MDLHAALSDDLVRRVGRVFYVLDITPGLEDDAAHLAELLADYERILKRLAAVEGRAVFLAGERMTATRADLRLRLVGESYKDYAARMAGDARAAELDRDALRAAVERVRNLLQEDVWSDRDSHGRLQRYLDALNG